jgi:hypothetical protein
MTLKQFLQTEERALTVLVLASSGAIVAGVLMVLLAIALLG